MADRHPARQRSRGPAHKITAEDLVQAAIAVGSDGFTMQDVARQLGISHQALYRWVSGRDELEDLVADHLVQQLAPPEVREDADWQEWLTEFAIVLRRELLKLDGMALRGLTRYHVSASFVRLYASGTDALTRGGMDPAGAAAAMEAFGTAVLGWVAREQSIKDQRRSGRRIVDEITAARVEANVPAPEPPRGPRATPDERYERFVRTLVAGLAAVEAAG